MSKSAALIILAAVLAYWAGAYFNKPDPVKTEPVKKTTYERVMETGTIRCGYTPYSVGLRKDPKTNQLSGIYYDVIDQIGKNLGLKVMYVEEVGWGDQIAGLNAGRYDMICSPVSLNSGRARAADFSIPLYYSPIYIWGSPTNIVRRMDAYSTKIATIDGEQTAVFAKNFFPKADTLSLPQNTPFSDLMMQVTAGKADVVFAEPAAVNEFLKTNPDTLVKMGEDKPLVVVPNIFLLKNDEYAFKQMIDNALRELFNTGMMDQIITRHEASKGDYIREEDHR